MHLRLRDDVGLSVRYNDQTRFGSGVTGLIDALIARTCAPLVELARREGPARLIADSARLADQVLSPRALGALYERPDVLREECLYPDAARVVPARLVAYGLGEDGKGTCAIALPPGSARELADLVAALERGAPRPAEGLGARLWDELRAAGALTDLPDQPEQALREGVTAVGHATVAARRAGVRIAIDPFAVPPAPSDPPGLRPLSCRALRPDAVFITHSHPDHFDLHALLRFGPDTPIYLPAVPRESLLAVDMALRLRELGFRRVNPLRWGDSVEVGPFRVVALPFYGEQPTDGVFLHPEARNLGNTYLVEAAGRRFACIADAGDDAAGNTRELAARAAAERGPIDALFGGYRAWRLHPIEFLGTSVARYLLHVPRDQWTRRQQLMNDADDLLDTAIAWRAGRVVPYANGGAPWFARIGLGPHGDDNPDFDPDLSAVHAAAARRPGAPPVRVMAPGEGSEIFA